MASATMSRFRFQQLPVHQRSAHQACKDVTALVTVTMHRTLRHHRVHTSYAMGTQRDGSSAVGASSLPLARDPRTDSNPPYAPLSSNKPIYLCACLLGNQKSYTVSSMEIGQQSQYWSCSRCSNRNDPARHPDKCAARDATR